MYRKETGKNYVEKNVIFEGYDLGKQFRILKQSYNKGNLTGIKRDKIVQLGFTFDENKNLRYKENWKLLEECVNDNIILNSCNKKYKNVDLYSWIKGTVKKHLEEGEILSEKQEDMLRKVFEKWREQVKIIDLLNGKKYIYPSINKASEALHNQFHVTKQAKSAVVTISNYLSCKTISPYKGRFMFYYATDEEVKKYLEENSVS